MGHALMASAQKRKSTKDSGTGDGSCDDGTGAIAFNGIECEAYGGSTNGSAKKNRKKTKIGYGAEDGLEAFGEHMRDADLSGIWLERERLHFERDMAECNKEERTQERRERQREKEKERRERREERVEQQKLEVEKFKALIEAMEKSSEPSRQLHGD